MPGLRNAGTARLVLLRHGESEWNASNRFAGWVDVDLTADGVEEAREAGRRLRRHGLDFDEAHVSLLRRARRTLDAVLHELEVPQLPVHASWRLNERHYGALQGLDRAEAAVRFGSEQVRQWRRGLDARPPALDAREAAALMAGPGYAGLGEPVTAESQRDTVRRVAPYWEDKLVPSLRAGRSVLVVAHGNSIRALMVHIERLGDAAFPRGEIPRATPRLYAFTPEMTLRAGEWLAA